MNQSLWSTWVSFQAPQLCFCSLYPLWWKLPRHTVVPRDGPTVVVDVARYWFILTGQAYFEFTHWVLHSTGYLSFARRREGLDSQTGLSSWSSSGWGFWAHFSPHWILRWIRLLIFLVFHSRMRSCPNWASELGRSFLRSYSDSLVQRGDKGWPYM